MKLTRNHTLKPTNFNSKLITCDSHPSQMLDLYCTECETILCNQCTSCYKGKNCLVCGFHAKNYDGRLHGNHIVEIENLMCIIHTFIYRFFLVQSVFSGDHKIVSTDEACKSLKEKLLNEGIPKLDKVFDSLDVLKNICMARKANEKDQVAELKREVQQKTNYMISILQSREKVMCEQIDIALEENIAKIDSGIQSTEKSMTKVSNFLEICKEWSQMTAENALLQLKPLLEQRLRDVTRDNKVKRMKGLKLDTISWNDTMTETILPLIQRFGDIQISKSSFRCIIFFQC